MLFCIGISGIRKCKNVATPVVSNIFDSAGEIASAVADVQAVVSYNWPWKIIIFVGILSEAVWENARKSVLLNFIIHVFHDRLRWQEESLTAEWISQFRSYFGSAPLLMIDANLHPVALEAACNCKFTDFDAVVLTFIWATVILCIRFLLICSGQGIKYTCLVWACIICQIS